MRLRLARLGLLCLALSACHEQTKSPARAPGPTPAAGEALSGSGAAGAGATTPNTAEPPRPGFVLYTATQTVVVPLDPGVGWPLSAPGLWIQDDRQQPPILRRWDPVDTLSLPRCDQDQDQDQPGACLDSALQRQDFAASGEPLAAERCRCVLEDKDDDDGDRDGEQSQVHGHDHGQAERDATAPPTKDPASAAPCAPSSTRARVAIVGGVLYSLGWDWNGACEGARSIYDATSTVTALIDAPSTPSLADMSALGCTEALSPAAHPPPWPVDTEALPCTSSPDELPRGQSRGRGRDPDADPGCQRCATAKAEAEVLVLRRGALWQVRDNLRHGGGVRWVASRPLSASTCPSLNDPCGEPGALPQLPEFADTAERWIASDGRSALTGTGEDYALWRADPSKDRTFTLPGVDASAAVIGVRVHADLGPLLRALAHD
ncbi:hypothetical protein G6O69_07370 [Pseudenhygromyxa sp. WMMC2535]|uniref:hypothetical protein n=1 Tax=Pseudenhygromyxa sp. WMMC2535 TaxID=2712867 RepID=UPI001554D0D1|nr:hypothetical protein [Pseudenhygromyxa sp. WMMC2535]NVB37647.1 hypothetical protein [Pseudenhygromyxa sp. WMMC2535]